MFQAQATATTKALRWEWVPCVKNSKAVKVAAGVKGRREP